MGRNLFTYALMGGLAEGADAYAQGLGEQQRAARELQMRRALQDDQQAFREQMGVGGRVAGSSGARVGAPAMTAAQAVADANTLSGVKDEELISGDFVPPNANRAMAPGYTQDEVYDPRDAAVRKTYGPDGQALAEGEKPKMVLDRNDPLIKDGLTRLKDLRERIYAGPNADDFAKAKQTQTESNLLEKAGSGDRKAGEGLLYAKGKDPVETEARADAQIAKADKDDRTDPNARRGGAGGGAPKAATVRSTKVDEQGNVIAVMSDGTTKPLGIKSDAFNARVAKVIGDMEKNDNKFAKLPADEKRRQAVQRLGAGGDAPAQSGTPAAGAVKALPAGAKQIGTSGGKPVYQTPDGKKFIQG